MRVVIRVSGILAKSAGRAKRGGQRGVNGQWYEGGQFLPSSKHTVKGQWGSARRPSGGGGKQEVAPYKWEQPPGEGMRSIFRLIAGTVTKYNHKTGKLEYANNPQADAYYGYTKEQIMRLIEKYNRGERWIPQPSARKSIKQLPLLLSKKNPRVRRHQRVGAVSEPPASYEQRGEWPPPGTHPRSVEAAEDLAQRLMRCASNIGRTLNTLERAIRSGIAEPANAIERALIASEDAMGALREIAMHLDRAALAKFEPEP